MPRLAWVAVVCAVTAGCGARGAEPAASYARDRGEAAWRPCVDRAGYQAVWVDDCDEHGICEDDGRAHYLACQPVVAPAAATTEACPALAEPACRGRDDCIFVRYRGRPAGRFAECFTEPEPGQCQANDECASGRCVWDAKVCSTMMCWGRCAP